MTLYYARHPAICVESEVYTRCCYMRQLMLVGLRALKWWFLWLLYCVWY